MNNDSKLTILYKIDELPDNYAYSLVKKEYKNFLSPSGMSKDLDKLKSNPRFISLLNQVCSNVKLELDEQIYCNNFILYHLNNIKYDFYLKNLYYELANTVNVYELFLLRRFVKIDLKIAIILVISSKSCFDIDTNISRVLFTISCSDKNTMSVENIKDILYYLFGEKYYEDIFLVNIKDTYLNIHDDDWINDSIININRNIDYATLELLDSLPIDRISSTIMKYKRYIDNTILEKRIFKDNIEIKDIVKYDLFKRNLSKYNNIQKAIDIIEKDSNLMS